MLTTVSMNEIKLTMYDTEKGQNEVKVGFSKEMQSNDHVTTSSLY